MQTLGLLLTQQMEERASHPLGFVSTDYAVLIWGLDAVPDPAPFFEATACATSSTPGWRATR